MNLLAKDERLVLFLSVAAVLVIVGGIFGEWWALSSVLNYIPEVIMLSLIPLLLWGFRKRIKRAFQTESSPAAPSTPIITSSKTRLNTLQVEPIQHYDSRSELPPFEKMLSSANATVDMSGLDFRIVVHQFMGVIRRLVYKNIRVTFLILDSNSAQVDVQSRIIFAGEDLKESIHKSLKLLCEEKEKLPPNKRGNLIIRLYDYPPEHSIIIIDEGHENAWIKLEGRPTQSDSSSRPSDTWHKSYDEARYSQYMNEYNILFSNSREYPCPTS